MTDHRNELTAEEVEALGKLLAQNASHAAQHFTDLAATWGLGGLHHELEELLKGLKEEDRPAVAIALGTALADYLGEFGPKGIVGQSDTYRDHA